MVRLLKEFILLTIINAMDALVVTSLLGVGSYDVSSPRYVGYVGHTGH